MSVRIFKGDSPQTRAAKRSFKHTLKRKKSKGKNNGGASVSNDTPISRETINYANKYIQKFCLDNNIAAWSKGRQNQIRIDEKFSLFEDPNNVLTKLLELLHNANTYSSFPTINVKGRISFGAFYLIDNLCWEIAKSRHWSVRFKNMHDDDRRILTHLRSLHPDDETIFQDDKAHMINETVSINRSNSVLIKQKYSINAKQITDMVVQGMREKNNPDFDLSPAQYQAISSTICEHFDNIYEHVPSAENGYLCGFYNKDLNEITILIFNFGVTIKQSFDNKTLPEEIKEEIESVVGNFRKFDWFKFNRNFTEENAMTLLAIQEGISSKLDYDASRGFGIMDYIEHCFGLNKKCKISIISGKTAIKIDDKYSISERYFVNRKRRIIAFNEANDIYSKPDKDYVRNIGPFFPGVIIETKIPLC